MNRHIKILNINISYKDKCFIIAEIGSNHNKDRELAKKLIHTICECGVDAIKFQTFRGEDIINKKTPSDAYGKINYFTDKKYWYEVLDGLKLPYEWYKELIGYAHSLGLSVIATPESSDALEFLETQSVDAYKIASMDVTYVQLLKKISLRDKPVILSTGMATLDEIKEARNCFKQNTIGILHCVSNYPLLPKDANVAYLNKLKSVFPNDIIGFSDHCPVNLPSLVAVSLGAKILEKHITLDKNMQGPDHHFSLEPKELRALVQDVRLIENMLAEKKDSTYPIDHKKAALFRRSIHAKKDIKKGEVIINDDVKIVRGEAGLRPKVLDGIIGMRAVKDIMAEEPINFCDLQKNE